MQRSSRRYRSVVFSRKYIQSMEVGWLVLVGAWKTCVTLGLRCVTTPHHLSFSFSWVGENCPLVCPSSFPPLSDQQITFSSSIIEDIIALRDAGRASLAYFYFDFRDVNKQKLQNLLPSLLIQLSSRSHPCHDILSKLYSAHDRGERKPSDRAMIECLKEMLILGHADLPTSLWMLLMSVQLHPAFHHLEKKSSSWWRNLSAFTFQTFTSVSRVGQSTTFRL